MSERKPKKRYNYNYRIYTNIHRLVLLIYFLKSNQHQYVNLFYRNSNAIENPRNDGFIRAITKREK